MMKKSNANLGAAIFSRIVTTTVGRSSSHGGIAATGRPGTIHTATRGNTIPRAHVDFNSVKQVSDAISLFDDMLRMRPLPSVIEFSKMLNLVVKMENYSCALHLFDKMRQCGVPYSDYILNTVINCCCRLKSVDRGFAVLGFFFKSGIRPDVTTFNTLLKGLLFENKITEAEMMLRKLSTENLCKVDEVTLGTVIEHYSYGNEDSMILFSSKHTATRGNTIPRAYVDFKRVKKVSDAISLFDDMLRMRPLPSVVAFTNMLSLVVKMKSYSCASHMFNRMRQRGVPYDEYILSIVINCCCHLNSVDHGFAVLGIFFKSGVRPNVTTFNTLIKGLFSENKITEAVMVFRKLSTENLCKVDEVTLATVIDRLCKARYRPTALTLLEQSEKQRCKPDVLAYSIIIDSFCKDLMIDEALQFFSKMVHKGISPDVVTYNSLIQGLCDSGRWKEAKEFSNQMLVRGILPNSITCTIFTSKLGCSPDHTTYNILVKGCLKRSELLEAKPLLEEMESKGFSLEAANVFMLIDHYHKYGGDIVPLDLIKKLTPKVRTLLHNLPNIWFLKNFKLCVKPGAECNSQRWSINPEILSKNGSMFPFVESSIPDAFTDSDIGAEEG